MVGDTCFTAEGTTGEVTNVWLKNMGSDRSFVDQIKMNRLFKVFLTGNHTRRSGGGSVVWVEGRQEWAVMSKAGRSGGGGDWVEKIEIVGGWGGGGLCL
ncbi:hypothetical protein Hanom_Chr02g00170371 [Helianthus anomalus]